MPSTRHTAGGQSGDQLMQTASTPTPSNGPTSSCEIIFVSCVFPELTRIIPERRIYVDSRLTYMLSLTFNEPFFQRGKFPTSVANASQEIILPNPWAGRGNSAPFDQRTMHPPNDTLRSRS